MKLLWIILLCLVSFGVKGQIITLFAGGGNGGDGSPAISASVSDPNGLVFDKFGNLYFTENGNHRIRKIDTNGIITTVAGTGMAGFSGDGSLATAALLNEPDGIAVDTSGNVYFADGQNNRIRKINISTGIITTVAGCNNAGFAGDSGLAVVASLYRPGCVCFDKVGNMFIGDYGNKRVRKVNISGMITTYAGNGLIGWGGDGGPAITARCNPFNVIATDDTGNLYVAEWSNNTVRKINTSGIISTLAGDTSNYLYNGDGIPAIKANIAPEAIALDDSGLLYISDENNNRIRKIDAAGIIHTIAGDGIAGVIGDDGPAGSAELNQPSGIAFDNCSNLFIGQVNNPRIRKVTFDPACHIHTLQTGIRNVKLIVGDIQIYPNPTTSILHVDVPVLMHYRLMNVVGSTVQAGNLSAGNNSISIDELTEGIYVLEISDAQQQIVRKIVKQ